MTKNLNLPMKSLNIPVMDLNKPMVSLNIPPSGSTTPPTPPTPPAAPTAPTTPTTPTTPTSPAGADGDPTGGDPGAGGGTSGSGSGSGAGTGSGTDGDPTGGDPGSGTASSGGTQNTSPTGQQMQIYSTAYNPSEAGGDINAQGGSLSPGQVAVNPSVIPYGTQFTVNNSALNSAAIAEGAPTDGNGNAIFTATDTGSAVVAGTAANANGYAGTPVVDFYAPVSSYGSMAGATSSAVTINIIKPTG